MTNPPPPYPSQPYGQPFNQGLTQPVVKKSYKTPVVLLVIGIVLIIAASAVGGALLFSNVSKIANNAKVMSAPGTMTRTLSPGTYVIYEKTALDPSTSGYAHSITPYQVTVYTGSGTQLHVSNVSAKESTSFDSGTYVGAVQFEVTSQGKYNIAVNPTTPTQVLVAPDVASALVSLLIPMGIFILGLGLGFIFLIIGFIMLLVRLFSKT